MNPPPCSLGVKRWSDTVNVHECGCTRLEDLLAEYPSGASISNAAGRAAGIKRKGKSLWLFFTWQSVQPEHWGQNEQHATAISIQKKKKQHCGPVKTRPFSVKSRQSPSRHAASSLQRCSTAETLVSVVVLPDRQSHIFSTLHYRLF